MLNFVLKAGAAGSGLRRRISDFVKSRSGNIAILFGLAAIPVILAGGAGVDYSRAFLVQQRLSAALDATALALGATSESDPQVLQQMAQDYFNANYPVAEIGVPGQLNINITDTVISMSASADLDTVLMRIAGINTLDVQSSVEVTKERTKLEVALVLDNTGSMGSSGKLNALKTAANALVNVMFGDDQAPDNLKFSLVPFAASVNVGTQYQNSGWIDVNGVSSVSGVQFEAGNANVFAQYARFDNKVWNGCVEARPTPNDTLDTAPDAGDPDTLFVPYFAPDEPDDSAANANGYWYGNNYLGDGVSKKNNNVDLRQRRVAKYDGKTVNAAGPHFNCEIQPLTALTNSKSTVQSAINAMTANGSTVIPIGLGWGWRTLSPGQPLTEGAPYDDDEVKKVLILLTDGQNDIGNLDNHNKTWYSGYGNVSDGRLGTTSANQAAVQLNARTATLCQNIKDSGILVFTITFQLNNSGIQNLMRSCATATTMYFNSPSNSELQSTFEEIGKQLSKLRISK